jgi:hypothetical protein
MKILEKIGRLVRSAVQARQHLAEIVEGTANQSRLLSDKLGEVIAALDKSAAHPQGRAKPVIEYQSALWPSNEPMPR